MDFVSTRPLREEERRQRREWMRGHYGITESDHVALFVGHDFRRKGLRYAVEAVARTKQWKLLVVGLGKTREYVDRAEELGIGPGTGVKARVLFVGPTGEMGSVYAAGDALLMPAFYEPSNLVLLESLSHGLPVISTEFLGASELVRDHDVGTIVSSPQDVDGLVRALEALPSPGTRAQTELAARARKAGAGVTPDAYVKALLDLYEQVRSG
jgi:glycosyltransferase involved in cell wall biosynthesis